MTRCDFPSIMAIICENFIQGAYNDHVELIDILFEACIDQHPEGIPREHSTVSRWLSGVYRVNQDICKYYGANSSHQKILAERFEDAIIPYFSDPDLVVQRVSELLEKDYSVTREKKEKLLALRAESPSVFLSQVLIFGMVRPKPKEGPERSDSNTSPLLHEHITNMWLPSPCRNFTGRETELGVLHNALKQHDKVFLQGIPGIGKSELAKAYAKKYRKEYRNILYLSYTGSLKRDVAAIPFYDDRATDDEDTLFHHHDRLLRTLKEDSLIIVDNFNTTATEDQLLFDVLKYQCKMLFTTKCTFDEYHYVTLEEISDHDILFELFSKYFKKASEYRETVESILEIVHYHTLSLELAARLLQTGYLPPELVLAKLREEKAAYSGEDIIKISKDGKTVQATYNQHVHTLFALFNLTHTQREVMQCMSMMPLSGIPARLFASWNALTDMNTVNKLEELGFLRIDDEHMLSLHPLMQDVVVADLVPSVTTCKSMIRGIGDFCHRHGRAVPHGRLIRQIAENTIHRIKKDDKDFYVRFLEQVNVSLPPLDSAADTDIVFSEITRLLSVASVGTAVDRATYLANKAMRLKTEFDRIALTKQAIEAFPEVTPENAHELYNIHGQLSHLYRLARDYEAAEREMQLALDLAAQYDGHENIKTLLTMNYACCLNDTHHHAEALEMMTLLEQKLRSTAPISHEHAAVLRKLAAITANCGDIEKGLSLLDESLCVYKHLCGEDEQRLQYFNNHLTAIRRGILNLQRNPGMFLDRI